MHTCIEILAPPTPHAFTKAQAPVQWSMAIEAPVRGELTSGRLRLTSMYGVPVPRVMSDARLQLTTCIRASAAAGQPSSLNTQVLCLGSTAKTLEGQSTLDPSQTHNTPSAANTIRHPHLFILWRTHPSPTAEAIIHHTGIYHLPRSRIRRSGVAFTPESFG